MRPTKCGLPLPKRSLALLGLVVALASPAWASIGVRHDSLRRYQATLSRMGWKVRVGSEWSNAPHAGKDPAEKWFMEATREQAVHQWIDDVLETFAKEDAAKVTAETKRAIARIASEAIGKGLNKGKTTLQTGITGSLRYRVGIFHFESYLSTNRWNKNQGGWEMENYRSGLAPLIALMPKERVKLAVANICIRNVPADAEVFFDDDPTTQKGISRIYTTPELEVGKSYSYTIRVRWQKDRQTRERSCTASLSGGDFVNVDFFINQGVTTKDPEVDLGD